MWQRVTCWQLGREERNADAPLGSLPQPSLSYFHTIWDASPWDSIAHINDGATIPHQLPLSATL